MKTSLLRLSLAVGLIFAALTSLDAASAGSAKDELQALVTRVRGKLGEPNLEQSLAPELAEFDALLAKHKGEITDDVAQILYMKATLYAQVLKNDTEAITLLQQVKKDFPGTAAAAKVDTTIASVKRQEASNRVQRALAVGSKFPEFSGPSVAGGSVTLSEYRGKVVLLDFWATWCGPCVAELPNVISAYDKHHAAGFDIIGISLDRADAKQKLISFTKDRKMPWAQIYDGGYWQSKLPVQFGVNSIPATYLLDREGNIVAKNLRGAALEREVARLVNAK